MGERGEDDRGLVADRPAGQQVPGRNPDTQLVLKANDKYVLGRPKVDEILITFIPDVNALLANILAGVIIDLARSMRDLLKPGGTLISSGIFVDRGDNVAQALERAGLPVRERKQEGDWLCLISVRER